MFIGDKRKDGIISRIGASQRTVSALVAAAMAAANGLLASLAAAQCTYDVTVIQAPACPSGGHPPTIGLALNEHSHVVGYQLSCGLGGDLAFLWTPQEGYQLLPLPPGAHSMQASDINDDQIIVGTLRMSGLGDRGFVYDPKTQEYTILHPVFPDSGWCRAAAIDLQGTVVGSRSISQELNPWSAFIWSGETGFLDIGVMSGPSSFATSISGNGKWVVGWTGSSTPSTAEAFHFDGSSIELLGVVPEGLTSLATDVLDDGTVIGVGRIQPHEDILSQGFLWAEGVFTIIEPIAGYENSSASSGNARRVVVGSSVKEDNPNDCRALLWIRGQTFDLNGLITSALVEDLTDASAITDDGRVLVVGHDKNSDVVTFILVPVDASPADLDGDCDTDIGDFMLLIQDWGEADAFADFDGDGFVGFADLLFLLTHWG